MTNTQEQRYNEDRRKLKSNIDEGSLEEITSEQTQKMLPFFALGGVVEIGDTDALLPLLDYLRFEVYVKEEVRKMREFEQDRRIRLTFKNYVLELRKIAEHPENHPIQDTIFGFETVGARRETKNLYDYRLTFYKDFGEK